VITKKTSKRYCDFGEKRAGGVCHALFYILPVMVFFFWQMPLANATNTQSFSQWQAELRSEALSKGISETVFDTAFVGVKPIERIIELDRSQPEFTLTLNSYLTKVVSATRAKKARAKLGEHRAILKEVSEKFGVQPRFIVALWGIETNFGQHTGGFSVIAALSTLAYDGRRSAYFRKELLNALQIIEEGHISAANMKGSWAGAMGAKPVYAL
jgi:membrane-bound lytic murein transglycosylase B